MSDSLELKALVEDRLNSLLARTQGFEKGEIPGLLAESMRYSLLAGGKRLRPCMLLKACEINGGDVNQALDYACALEMIHTYSLIHDDLPGMDDDCLRRGKPTNHVVFGVGQAILAGDGLLNCAFETMLDAAAARPERARDSLLAIREIATGAGVTGMIGGQVMDLAGEHKKLPLESLKKLHAHKTGAMIEVSAVLGCLAAGLSLEDPRTKAAERYARGIGLAFQIVDDVLDVTADAALLGKPIGSDAENEKTTFLTYYTTDEALQQARTVTNEAKEALAEMPHNEFLMGLADYLVSRNH